MFKTRFISMLALLLMAVSGAWATITVTWNNNDITGSGNSFTKDGVTITAGSIDFDEKSFEENGTFTTTLGNFTKIEVVVTNGFCDVSGTGWSGDSDKRTWTGNASSVSFIGDIYGDGNGIKFVFTIGPATVAVTGVTLAPTSATLTLGETETVTLIPTVLPAEATDKSVTWSSSNEAVATVTNGVVTAVAAGEATITATATNGTADTSDDKTATCTVTVAEPTYTVTVKEGTEDASNWQGKAGEGEYQSLPLEGVAANTAVSVKYSGAKKAKSVKAVKKKPDLLSGVFSVSASKKVKFSKGNLRYASGTWSFFSNQYDYYTSYSADAWDHFGWSTSATTYGMNTSTDKSTYSGNFVDWGSNSDLQTALGTGWFTLSSAESTYLFNTRSASTVGGTSNGRYAKAKVNGVWGVILFPDTYTHPDGVTAPTGVNATGDTGWNGNNYSSADWTKMESAGCVFLPGAGYRDGESLVSTGIFGAYWSATSSGKASDYSAYDFVYYYSGYLQPAFTNTRNLGFCVRLVREVTE